MRFLLAFIALAIAATAETFDGLKNQFPAHVAGDVTDKSDPAVVQCYRKYFGRVQALTMEDLPLAIQRLKDDAVQEMREIEWRLKDPKNRIKSSKRLAESQNGNWLKQKLIPYLGRLEQFQRGR